MYELLVKNEYNKQLNLTNNNNYYVLSVEGLANLNAEVFTQSLAFKHGSTFKNSKISERNIVITIKPRNDIEKNRIALYDFFRPASKTTLYYRNGSRNVFIDAIVESFESDLFTDNEVAQISLLATEPFFKGNDSNIDISKTFNNFRFPFNIDETGVPFSGYDPYKTTKVINVGEVETGVVIKAIFERDTNGLNIYNYHTGEKFNIDYYFLDGDELTIDTIKKTVILKRNAETFNLIGYKTVDSTWFQLPYGSTTFTYNANGNDEFIKIYVNINPLYYGV